MRVVVAEGGGGVGRERVEWQTEGSRRKSNGRKELLAAASAAASATAFRASLGRDRGCSSHVRNACIPGDLGTFGTEFTRDWSTAM